MATSQQLPAPATTAVWEDFIDIFTSPSEVFTRRQGGNVWVPLLIITAFCGVIFFAMMGAMQPILDAEWQRIITKALAQNPGASAEQMQKGAAFFKWGVAGSMVIGAPISMALAGLFLWLIGKMFGSAAALGDCMIVATYAWIPRLVGLVVAAVLVFMTDPAKLNSFYSMTLSAARFMDRDATPVALLGIANRVDLFILWETALLAIGLSVVGKIERSQAFLAAALLWVLGSLPVLMQK